MKILCPHCNSPNILSSTTGRRAGVLIGALAGAAIGFRLGYPLGSGGALSTRFTGLILGAVSGYNGGLVLGKKIDDIIVNNYLCYSCFFPFNN